MANNNIQDPRTLGVQGLKGLLGINKLSPSALLFINMAKLSSNLLGQIFSPVAEREVGNELINAGYGQSLYDKYILNMSLVYNINETRALFQPWYDQLANGALKFLSTTGTTFIDNTLGLLVGIGQGVVNKFDDNDATGFWSGMWNNAVTNAMYDVQEKIELALPNYMTHWELEAPFYERMFSANGAANFWGNDILKNAGFTVGTIASLIATGGAAGALGKALKLGSLTAKAGNTMQNVGKFSKWAANTFVSTIGESSIEALNTYRPNKELMDRNIESRKLELVSLAELKYYDDINRGIPQELALLEFGQTLTKIESDTELYKQQMEEDLIDASNAVLAANMATLAVSNNLTLGSIIRGGYGNARNLLLKAVKSVDGKEVTSATDIARGMMNGTLKFQPLQIKHGAAKVGAHWLLESTQEGLEEGILNIASNTALMNTQARMNKWARKNSMLGSMINPDADEELANISKAINAAYQDQFGAANSLGWTEVAAGFITGALGVVGARRNKLGKLRPTWQGGIKESYETIYGERSAILEQINMLNIALTSGKFAERAKHAALSMAIKSKLDAALRKDNILDYKNAELEMLVSDALYARDMGLLDSYLEMFNLMSENVSDNDINELRTLSKNEKGISALDNLTDNEVKQRYLKKAQSSKKKIENILESYDRNEKLYGKYFSDENRRIGLLEYTFKDSLLWDTYRRIHDLEERNKEILRKLDNATPSELLELRNNETAINNLTKLSVELKSYLNNKENLKNLDKEITAFKTRASKIRLYKDAEKAIESYSQVLTLRDIVDIYSLSPEDTRQLTLNKAIDLVQDENIKRNLKNFRDYVNDTEAVDYLIDKELNIDDSNIENLNEDLKRQLDKKVQMKIALKAMLNEVVEEMLDDDSPIITRQSLKEKLEERALDIKEEINNLENTALGVKLSEDEKTYDIEEAYNNGNVTDDDFYSILNDEGEEERVPGDRIREMFKAATESKNMQDLSTILDKIIEGIENLDELKKTAVKQKDDDITITVDDGMDSDSMDDDDNIFGSDEDNNDNDNGNTNNSSSSNRLSAEEKEKIRNEIIDIANFFSGENTVYGGIEKDSKGYNEHKDEIIKNLKRLQELYEKAGITPDQGPQGLNEIISTLTKYYGIKLDDVIKDKDKDSNNDELDTKKGLENIISSIKIGYNNLINTTNNLEKEHYKSELRGKLKNLADYAEKHNINLKELLSKEDKKLIDLVVKEVNYNTSRLWKDYSKKDKKESTKNTDDKSTGQKQSFDNTNTSQIRDSEVSMNGNLFTRNVPSELRKGHIVPNTTSATSLFIGGTTLPNGSLGLNFNIQEIIDKFVTKIFLKDLNEPDVKKRTPIHYLHFSHESTKVIDDIIFLAYKFDDVKSDLQQYGLTESRNEVITALDGQKYLIIGTFGHDETYRKGTEDMHSRLIENIKEKHSTYIEENKNTTATWYVDTEHTNRMKDISDGIIVTQTENEDSESIKDVRDLLNDKSKNPKGLDVLDLKFVVIENTQHKNTENVDDELDNVYQVDGGYPGQVYMYIDSIKGGLVPIYIETLFYNEVGNEDTEFKKEILNTLTILVDPLSTMKDREEAIAKLNDYFIFQKGVNNLHLNKEDSKFWSNTLAYTLNGKSDVLIDFNEYNSKQYTELERQSIIEQNIKLLDGKLKELRPRVNIKYSILNSNPGFYLNSGLLRTNVSLMFTSVANTYLYPLDINLDYVPNKYKNKDTKVKGSTRFYYSGAPYYYDGNDFLTSTRLKIQDSELIKELTIAFRIFNTKVNSRRIDKTLYYKVDEVYYEFYNGGIKRIDDKDTIEQLEDRLKREAKKQEKKDNAAKKAAEIKPENNKPSSDSGTAKESSDTTITTEKGQSLQDKEENTKEVKKPESLQKNKVYNPNIVNSSLELGNSNTSNSNNSNNSSIFVNILLQRGFRLIRIDLVNTINSKLDAELKIGKDGTIDLVLEALSKLGIDTSQVKDREGIKAIIDEIKCR